MTTYYLDSSENPSDLLKDAIDTFGDLAEAQAAAVRYAKSRPETVFYVRQVIESSKLVYKAEAKVTLNSEVINDPAL